MSSRNQEKIRAVFVGGVGGMVAPLMPRFQDEFEIVAAIRPVMPRFLELALRAMTVRWPRNAWYRRWRYYVEKTPFAFRMLSRAAARQLRPLEGEYDILILVGAMYSPGLPINRPIFVITDSCRWLSSNNPSDEVSHFRSERDRIEWLSLEGDVYRSATRNFVGNSVVKEAMVQQYGVAADRVVATGLGPGPGFEKRYVKAFDGKSILYIGKGDFEKKGGTVLLDAFKLVRRQIPDAVLHIVGQDRLPDTEGVVNHGFVRDRQKLVGLMRAAHVFSLPSLVDRNPLSVIEAMSTATPCVVSDYGAIPEIIGDGGLVTPCSDVPAVAEALVRILSDNDLASRLGSAGRARFEQSYTWNGIWSLIHNEIVEATRHFAPAI